MTSVNDKKKDCCGCGLCKNICPANAIEMIRDEEGFLYPKIDEEKCINCNLCRRACIFNKEKVNGQSNMNGTYLFKHKDDNIRMNSRSGGVFVAFSDYILQNNGAVYGCILDSNGIAFHFRAEDEFNRNKMCKSKYVQSDLKDVFNEVLNDLKKKNLVLFTGTGCQVEALLNFLKIKKTNTDTLFTIDIICHGCNSPLIFKEYLAYMQKKYKGKILKFEFRNKNLVGWDGYVESFETNKKIIKETTYRELFNTDAFIRPSCYNCKFTKVDRNSDITIGDAWGIKEHDDDFNDNKGVSLVIIQSNKGLNLFNKISNKGIIRKVNINDYLQLNLKTSSTSKIDRSVAWNLYYQKSFESLVKKYARIPAYKQFYIKVKYFIRKMIQKDKFLP